MDFFKFNPTSDPTFLERGEIINNITSSMWVERYSEPGEFEFEGQLSSGLSDVLPLGTIVSHIDTLEFMIVETKQIKEKVKEDPIVTITGRSFPSFLENRIVGTNLARLSSTIAPYNLAAGYTWDQAVQLINDHIRDPTNVGDRLVDIQGYTNVAGSGAFTARNIERGTVLERVLELIAIDELGIRTRRKNNFVGAPVGTVIEIYRGLDKSSTVLFSWKDGDLDAAEYLLTQKDLKTSAMVVGQYVYTVVDTSATKYDRRMMIVDASDIDGDFGAPPVGTILADTLTAMGSRGYQALANQNRITLTQSDISKTTQNQYRRDYNMGDLVTIEGNFNQMQIMRVIEYAEIEDENGESGHPTLDIPVLYDVHET